MSLFKVCSWWNFQCSDIESNYDSFSLLTCRFLGNGSDCIIVVSHCGYLSILQPAIRDIDLNGNYNVQHSSILVETILSDPILGVLCGNFFGTQKTDNNVVAVLHPFKLVLYTVVTSGGPMIEIGDQSKLQVVNDFPFTKSAFSFCQGKFGNVKGKDYICVQFIDGSLKFFEQDGLTNECSLPDPENRNIPSNILYVPRTDCFVVLCAGWDLECYRYLNLSESYEKKFTPIWTLNIGEYILDMHTQQTSNFESVIVILGENNLICVSDTGKNKWIKKLDYTPICFHSFVVGWYWESDAKLMIAVTSENGSLLVYNNSTLVWCAELFENLVSIKRANFAGLGGGIVTLSENGLLNVCYLGTEPSLWKVPPMNLNKLDYEKTRIELDEMENELRCSIDNSEISLINATAGKDLLVESYISFENQKDGALSFCELQLSIKSFANLEQVQITFFQNPAFVIPEHVVFMKNLMINETKRINTAVYLNASTEIVDCKLLIVVSFISKQENVFKLTVSVLNQQIVELPLLFPDFDLGNNGQAVGLQAINSTNITTIIVAKNSNRYRIQSDSLPALSFVLSMLTQLLEQQSITISVKSIPKSTVEFLLSCSEKHFNMKKEMDDIITLLNAKTLQLRFFERYFLVKMQGKTMKTLDGINILLKDNYEEILESSQEYKSLKLNFKRVQNQLTTAIAFIGKALKYGDLPSKISESLQIITRPVTDWRECSWEETIVPYIVFFNNLYQTKLTKNQIYENFSFKQETFSMVRFKKHLKQLLCVIVEDSLVDSLKETEQVFNDIEDNKRFSEVSEWHTSTIEY